MSLPPRPSQIPITFMISILGVVFLSAETVETPEVTEQLGEKAKPSVEKVEGHFEKPDEIEKVGFKDSPDEDRQADAKVATPENIERCHDFVNAVLDENMRIRKKEGLSDPEFSVAVRGLINPYAIMSLMTTPGKEITFEIKEGDGLYTTETTGGSLTVGSDNKTWNWKTPEKPGTYCVTITNKDSGTTMLIHAMVKVPWDGANELDGYKIGEYKKEPLNGNKRYEYPTGFVKVTDENADTWVSPHLQLKQFVCKQSNTYPSYILLETRLLLKLEMLLSELRKGGVATDSLYITSAFRTPHYNRAIGNKTDYSRHLYGDAAGIFVDKNDDYRLDDLNKDGKVDNEDAKHLSNLVEKVSEKLPDYFEGGLGFYGFNSQRTAFIHTDTRGYTARWGFE